jgi:6-pyruvoyltetrahydropterin/6-carboxytetrahydropterin synthase
MYEITKTFRFEAAHVLDSSYMEACQMVHGHSYKLEITIKAWDLNEDGMVVDFKRLKEIVQENIIDVYDHKLILSEQNIGIFLNPEQDVETRIVRMADNPTAENMTRDFYYILIDAFRRESFWPTIGKGMKMKVKLWETETGCVEFSYNYEGEK